ncbi:MAG: PEP-CTERM sorting domain-containing protein [Phycisphaerae bacterium]|nr:PEP-CTERM sorting domain-containing protein [Phycisphaerae bacterium]
MRFNPRFLCLMLVCSVLMGPAAGSVWATAVVNGSARLNWPVSISGDISWTERTSESGAFAANENDSDQDSEVLSGWGVATSAFAQVSTATASASTQSTMLQTSVWAMADGVAAADSFADTLARRHGYFTANSDGVVMLTASYEVILSLQTEQPGEHAEGHSTAYVRLGRAVTPNEWDLDELYLHGSVKDGAVLNDSETGFLSVQLWFDAGDVGYLEMAATGMGHVTPEPASLVMVCVGFGLTALRRRLRVMALLAAG